MLISILIDTLWHHSFNNIHKNNIYFDAEVGSLFPLVKKGGVRCLFKADLHVHYGRHQFNSWEDGVRSVRCLWTAQQHGVLQVGVSLNMTHLEIHGVEQWTFQTSKVSKKWRELFFTTGGWRTHKLHLH